MKATPGFVLTLALMAAPLASADKISDLTDAAGKGEPAASIELANLYLRGEGTAKDVTKAVELLSKAAEQGDVSAQLKLGGMYVSGKDVRRSSSEAAKWFTLAAQAGNATAQLQLARMSMSGAGVPKDDVAAYKWSSLAAAQGDLAAKKMVAILTGKMTPDQVAQGQSQSRDFIDSKKAHETLDSLGDPPVEVDPVDPQPPSEPK